MKILKLLGIAVGIHAVILVIILANPGCSSTTAEKPKVAAAAPADPPAPSNSVDPAPVAAPASGAAEGPSAVPPSAVPDAAAPLFNPTRPGTAAAAALQLQPEPEAEVTPVTTYVVTR